MFLVRYFRDSFFLNRILPLRKESLWKIIIYFLVISIISLFPYNYVNLKEGGWKLGFVEHNFLSQENIGFELPDHITMNSFGMKSSTEENDFVEFKNSQDGNIIFRFLFDGDINETDRSVKQLVFTRDEVFYFRGDQTVIIGDYSGFEEEINFHEINLITESNEKNERLKGLAAAIEGSFGRQNAFYTIVNYSFIQLALYVILILILAAVLQLFRFGYVKFMSYIEGIKVVILSMTIPSILAFVVGFATHGFAPVIIQLGIGIVLMIVMIRYAKVEFSG